MTRPHHTDPVLVASVATGGAIGSLARYGLSHTLPVRGGWPLATLTENLVGALLLGLLLQWLLHRGHETHRRRWVRLTFGTGVLGGFTTYSAFALELHGLLAGGRWGVAAGYALVTLATGNAMLAFAALLLGALCGLERRACGGVLAPILTHCTWSLTMLVALPLIFR